MTYKDHGEIALIFRKHLSLTPLSDDPDVAHDAITGVLDDVADYCERDNPRFDRDRFMIGAGIGIV